MFISNAQCTIVVNHCKDFEFEIKIQSIMYMNISYLFASFYILDLRFYTVAFGYLFKHAACKLEADKNILQSKTFSSRQELIIDKKSSMKASIFVSFPLFVDR